MSERCVCGLGNCCSGRVNLAGLGCGSVVSAYLVSTTPIHTRKRENNILTTVSTGYGGVWIPTSGWMPQTSLERDVQAPLRVGGEPPDSD